MTLTNQELVYILTTDPLLGTDPATPTVANGAFNRELSKLIVNDLELEAAVNAVSQRTYGADSGSNAPDPLPVTPVNAPASPADGAIHITYYDDFEIVVQWDGALWNEVFRVARVGGGTVYAEVNAGSGASVGTVSGTTLASLVNPTVTLQPINEDKYLTGNHTANPGGVNKVFNLQGFDLIVSDAGHAAGDRFIVWGPGTFKLNGGSETLTSESTDTYEYDGSAWILTDYKHAPPTTTSGTGATVGLVSADTIEGIAATVATVIKKQETLELDADGYVDVTFPRVVGGVSMTAAEVVNVIPVQDAGVAVDKATFTTDVKSLDVRMASGLGNMGIYWTGAAADDQVTITYWK